MKFPLFTLRQGFLLVLAILCTSPVLAQSRKIDPEDLYRYWILLNTSIQLEAPNSGLNLDKPGCATVTYTVGSDGVPMDVKVVRLVPKSDLDRLAQSAVSKFRYGPALNNRISEPVDTYYIVPFNAPDDPAQRKQLLEACRLPGYGA